MLRPDGYVKVLDFGIAKLTERQRTSDDHSVRMTTLVQTHPGLLMGTVRYMSPEQMRGQPADTRSDIWSLGVVVYEMVGGVPPFSAATPSDCIASVLKTEPPPLSSVVPDVPIGLRSIVQKALRKNRNERYQTTAEVLADLRVLTEIADRSGRRYICGSRQDRRLHGAHGGLAETLDDNSDSDRRTARRKFARGREDCDSASRRRFPSLHKPAAIRRHEVESSAGQRETGREYAPAHAAKSDRFQSDARSAADLSKQVSRGNRRGQRLF